MKSYIYIISILLLITIQYSPFTLTSQTSEPILRLNSNMHSVKINRISTDKHNKYVLTSSKDKTAKLWDANTGELLKTFRPPIDHGNEGMLYAGALSPNGELAAIGGWSIDNNNDIFIINTSTGEIVQRLSGFKNVIRDIEFSPCGNYIAAGLGSSQGVIIYKKNYSDFEKYKTLTGYTDNTYNVAFDNNGRLATVSFDGKIRLYDKLFNLINETTGSGNNPYAITFSSDGSKIAVGYNDSHVVDVFSGTTLKLLYKPNCDGMNKNGGFEILAFSSDNSYLYGGGFYRSYVDGNWWNMIRKWGKSGKGSYTDLKACKNTIMDIVSMQNGDLLYCSALPDFGKINSSGNNIYYKEGEIYSFRNNQFNHLKTNFLGDAIAFKPYGKNAQYFSVQDKSLSDYQGSEELIGYTSKNSETVISEWEDSYHPKINNNAVSFLPNDEHSRSVDISPDGNKIIWGADWNIYYTNKNGDKLWETEIQSIAWAAKISGNGKLVVATLGTGTISWYRITDGELLLTLYAHPDGKNWVLFTPSGYYDASPGAESLFGWHLNNGYDKAAYFFPASKFRNRYYRPDIIDNILITLNEDEAVRIADIAGNRKTNNTSITKMLPPIVNITSPHHNQKVNSKSITVEYSVNSPGNEEISGVKFLVDGRPVENQRGFKPVGTSQKGSKSINIPAKDVTIQVLAQNQHGWSEPDEVRIIWEGHSEADIFKPTLYVLSIGVSDYQNNDYDLKYAAKDAKDFAQSISMQKGGLYKDVIVKTLTDSRATKDDILDGLDWLQRETTSRDMAMIFIAGHGVNDNVGTFYYLPYEADINSLRRTGLMFTEIKYTTSTIAGKVVAFVDACHSGNVMGSRRAPDVNSLVNELSDVESGAIVFTSSTGKQYSLEDDSWGNGAFTKALIEGLNGKADYSNKEKITIKSLDLYIAERVKELTMGKQSPTVVIPESMSDFPIGIVK